MTKSRDETYWENYYRLGVAPEEPSEFARYVTENYIRTHKTGAKLVELGCGNGRDARHFASNELDVLAVDLCVGEIDHLTQDGLPQPGLRYEAADFTLLPDGELWDYVYSRFTLHSVDAGGQQRAIEWAYRNLGAGGHLFIETRGQLNELYQLGEPVDGEPDAFIYNDHYRRFVDFERFVSDIKTIGFAVLEAAEDTGFAPFEDTDYHFIRVVAEKEA